MRYDKKLFTLINGAHCGCGAKVGPWILSDLLSDITDSSQLNSFINDWEDVGIFEWGGKVLLQNVDIITPVCDDPFLFGKIGVANALSDIYAKGGYPLFAMNMLGYPFAKAPIEWARHILNGGVEALKSASVSLLGGHTIEDSEPKYGIAIVGYIEPGRFIKNSAVRVGDSLFLTKPLGSGVIVTGMKNFENEISDDVAKVCLNSMVSLNKSASDAMINCGVNACTDITGFGLAGHLAEMLSPGKFIASLEFDKIPRMDGVDKLIEKGIMSPALHRNQDYVQLFRNMITYKYSEDILHSVLFDPQTSGGLLISVSQDKINSLSNNLKERNVPFSIIGQIIDQGPQPLIMIE